jgi:hypothetical protein
MKQYLLNIMQPEGGAPQPDALKKIMADVRALIDETKAQGAWVLNGGLHPPSASTVARLKDGEVLVTDGPYIEAKEFIGGLVVVKAKDLDGALAWAGKLTRVIGLPIEVRPFQGEIPD